MKTPEPRRDVPPAPARACPTALHLAILAAVFGGFAHSAEIKYETELVLLHSDNLNLSEDNEVAETVVIPRLRFEAREQGSAVTLQAGGEIERRHYVEGDFEDETRGEFVGQLDWSVLPQRLDFVVQDYLSLQPVDELEPFSPGNQQQINVFVAGPTLHARFDGTTRGQLDMRYINTYAEEDETFDGDRYTAAGRVFHQLSANHSVSANLEASDVRFDSTAAASDYNRYDGYINSTVSRSNTDLSVDLGYSRLEFDGGASKSYPLARANLDWRISPRSVLRTTVRYQLNDTAQSLILPIELDFEGERRNFNSFRIPDSVVQPNIFRERLVRMRYAYNGERLDLRVAPYYRRIHYVEGLANSQDRHGGTFTADYRLRPRLTLTFLAANERRDYIDISREDKEWVAGIGLANRFTRHWTGRVEFERRERDSTQPDSSYEENAVMFSASYRR